MNGLILCYECIYDFVLAKLPEMLPAKIPKRTLCYLFVLQEGFKCNILLCTLRQEGKNMHEYRLKRLYSRYFRLKAQVLGLVVSCTDHLVLLRYKQQFNNKILLLGQFCWIAG